MNFFSSSASCTIFSSKHQRTLPYYSSSAPVLGSSLPQLSCMPTTGVANPGGSVGEPSYGLPLLSTDPLCDPASSSRQSHPQLSCTPTTGAANPGGSVGEPSCGLPLLSTDPLCNPASSSRQSHPQLSRTPIAGAVSPVGGPVGEILPHHTCAPTERVGAGPVGGVHPYITP